MTQIRLFGSFLFCCGVLSASVVLDTIPPGLNSCCGYGVIYPSSGQSSLATSFTSPGNFNLTQIGLDLFTNPSPPTSVVVEILADDGGLPGPLVGSSFVLTISNPTSSIAIDSTPVSGITLTQGANYWLAILPNTGDVVTWTLNPSFPGSLASSLDDGNSWRAVNLPQFGSAAFELQGSASPEPAYAYVLAGGLFGLVALTRKRRSRSLALRQ